MTWLQAIQLLGPGLIALAGAWRANSKTAKRLAALEAEHELCTKRLDKLAKELGVRNENPGGGAMMHAAVAHVDDTGPITKKHRKQHP